MSEEHLQISYPRVTVGFLGALVVLFAAFGSAWFTVVVQAWLLVAGFGLLTGACLGTSRRFVMPVILGLILVVFCGLSAVVAVPESFETADARAKTLSKEELALVTPAKGINNLANDDGFQIGRAHV